MIDTILIRTRAVSVTKRLAMFLQANMGQKWCEKTLNRKEAVQWGGFYIVYKSRVMKNVVL